MNTKTFTVSLLAASAYAGPNQGVQAGIAGLGKLGQDPAFASFNAQYNKNTQTVEDFVMRQQIYHNNANEINRINRAGSSSDPTALKVKMNWTGDLTPEEYGKLINLDQAAAESKAASLDYGRSTGLGIEDAHCIDHFADGFMTPVKNQGGCGSCWTFSANTTLEGTLAKKQDTSPVRISEQQIVDCTLTTNAQNQADFGKDYGAWGCQGGWMDYSWDFHKDQGYMYDSDYPYFSGNSGSEGACNHDATKTKGNVSSYGQITTNVTDMKAKAMQQPLAVALNASSSAFQFYSSGVVKAGDNCGSQLNHAVVVVGFTDGSPNPDPSPGPDPEPTPDPTPRGDCTVTKWWHTCEDVEDDRRALQASDHDDGHNTNYFKVQNSWGTNWGDDGFILMEIRDGGNGVCGMYNVMEWVDGCEKDEAGCSAGR